MAIADVLNKPFLCEGSRPCWTFCLAVLAHLGLPVPAGIAEMDRVEAPAIGDVVLFESRKGGFHAGVVWPTTVHFVHCRPPLCQPDSPPICRRDRLSDPLYRDVIDGFYRTRGARCSR